MSSSASGTCGSNFTSIFYKLISWAPSDEIGFGLGPQNPLDVMSTMVQVMAWCHQATSHYLSQCWPRSMLPYGVTSQNELDKSSTYWGWDKMDTIFSQHVQINFLVWKNAVFDSNFTDICSQDPINDTATSDQIMAWHQSGYQPLSKLMMA